MQSEKRLVKMTRKDLTNNILEVEHTDGTEHWLVVKTTLHPKKVNLDREPKSQKCFFLLEIELLTSTEYNCVVPFTVVLNTALEFVAG